MKNLFSLFDLLLLIGMTQGVITSVLLFRSKKNQPSNTFLALAIIAFCLLSSKMLLNTLGINQTHYFRFFPIGIEYAIAPLLYFYVATLITPGFKFYKKHYWHLVPFLIFQCYAFFIYFNVVGIESFEAKNTLANTFWYKSIKAWEDYLVVFSIGGYLLVGFFKLKQYRQLLNDSISDNTFPTFGWLMNVFILSSIMGLIILINLLLDFFFNLKNSHYFHWQAQYLYTAFLIYYLGFVGYQQPSFEIQGIDKTEAPNNNLNEDKFNAIKQQLSKALAIDKVYLNPTLNAKQLAKKLSISQTNLSTVVNRAFNKNFRDLINHYRLEEFKSKLGSNDNSHLSILSQALECGFNSEASFYRIFKKQTGMSPKEYIRNI
ncbi:MAG: helix-turn-helix domain-containing protein [Proteobacteria bacterium]|nr:helix-turn-helix domain-containing protein [Pseudomonadota bacterium]